MELLLKLRFSSLRHRWPYPTLIILCSPLVLLLTKTLFGFPIFLFWAYLLKVILSVPAEGYSERTCWRLFWAYLLKVILSVPAEGYSSVPAEGYFERTWWRLFWAYLLKVILSVPDEGYFERTCWRLFQKHAVRTTFDIYKVDIIIIISSKCKLFSLWYSWKIVHLSISNNHSLTQYHDCRQEWSRKCVLFLST